MGNLCSKDPKLRFVRDERGFCVGGDGGIFRVRRNAVLPFAPPFCLQLGYALSRRRKRRRGEWKNRSTTSLALFNLCVVNWFGTWGIKALAEVGKEFTNNLDMGDAESVGGSRGVGKGEQIMQQIALVFKDPFNSLR